MFITAVCVIFLIKPQWPKNKSLYDTVVHTLEQKKRWMMLKTMLDGNQTLFNNFHHQTTWWPNECNMFDSTMLDDVTLTCLVDPFGQALTEKKKRNSVRKQQKNSTLRSPNTVSLFSITSPPVPGYFLSITECG